MGATSSGSAWVGGHGWAAMGATSSGSVRAAPAVHGELRQCAGELRQWAGGDHGRDEIRQCAGAGSSGSGRVAPAVRGELRLCGGHGRGELRQSTGERGEGL
jgi:hypothetical protein